MFRTYLYLNIICCLSEIQNSLAALHFYLLGPAALCEPLERQAGSCRVAAEVVAVRGLDEEGPVLLQRLHLNQ